ncbi:MAG: helix-turn-helix transcriptional regulator [Acidobacteriota bacterium]
MLATPKPERQKSRIIGLKEVMLRVPWSKTKIYRDMKAGKFPPQAQKLEGSTSAGWHEDAIDNFVESLRTAPAAKDRIALAKEVTPVEVSELDHPHRPLTLKLRQGADEGWGRGLDVSQPY